MKAVGYIRVSTGRQETARQKDIINNYATHNNYIVSNCYEDFAISGAKGKDEREGLSQLFSLTKNDVDIILISELSRSSRQSDILSVAQDLKTITDNGIDIFISNTNTKITKGFTENLIDLITLITESHPAS